MLTSRVSGVPKKGRCTLPPVNRAQANYDHLEPSGDISDPIQKLAGIVAILVVAIGLLIWWWPGIKAVAFMAGVRL
jgi:hypothetical protein